MIRDRITLHCPSCKQPFFKYHNGYTRRKYCSQTCSAQAKILKASIKTTCINCGKEMVKPRYKSRYISCSVQCGLDNYFKHHKGENHPHYRITKLRYSSMHSKIRKIKGDAVNCFMADVSCKGGFEWANKYHKNKLNKFDMKEIDDFIPLCESHHTRFDRWKSVILEV